MRTEFPESPGLCPAHDEVIRRMDAIREETGRKMDSFASQLTAQTRWLFAALLLVVSVLSGFIIASRSDATMGINRVEAEVVYNRDERVRQMELIDAKLYDILKTVKKDEGGKNP